MIKQHNQAYWIPLSDLMTGLMMLFLLISISFMLNVEQTTTLVVKEYQETKKDLQLALQKEFNKDLKQWNAEILGDMTIRFNDPEVLFDIGKYTLKPKFKKIINQFMPRYINLISSDKYKNAIAEIRIEGHTSPIWQGINKKIAYIKNIQLSQERAFVTLKYILNMQSLNQYEIWIHKYLSSSGFSSSKPILDDKTNIVSNQKSQRIEFVILTNADKQMQEMSNKVSNISSNSK